MTSLKSKSIRWSRRLSHVPRWAVVPTIRQQNVAEHSFHVARTVEWLIATCAMATGRNLSAEHELVILKTALSHDDQEAATGDRPGPNKPKKDYANWGSSELFVKIADLLEALVFVKEEQRFGNKNLREIEEDLFWQLSEVLPYATYRGEKIPYDEHGLTGLYYDDIFQSHPAMERNDELS